MSFISFKFIIFVAISLFLYYLLPKKMQWICLLSVSITFYLCAGIKAIVFLYITTLSTYLIGIKFGKINNRYTKIISTHPEIDKIEKRKIREYYDKQKRFTLLLVLFINFGMLFILKYFSVIESFGKLFSEIFNISNLLSGKNVILPLGISYYTFQSIGYVIDLYRNKNNVNPEKNFFRYALFISFFPQLVQGPISRFDELKDQLDVEHEFVYDNIKYGIQLMFWGYFKKLIIADRLSIVTNMIMNDPGQYKGFYLVFATFVSWIELYMDFSAGTDIARGTAQLFGIILPENFRQPLFAENIAEFWRRWHMSLNNWWRDYIFYPITLSSCFNKIGKKAKKIIGNNAGKKIPSVMAMILVRVINGIWHGANPIFIVGGLYHGIIMGISFLFENQINWLTKVIKINTECKSWKIIKIIRTYIIISIPRIIAKSPNLRHAKSCILYMFSEFNPWIFFDGSMNELGVSAKEWTVVIFSLCIVFIVSLIREKGYSFRNVLAQQNILFRWGIYIILFIMIVLFGTYGSGYDSSSFQYAQF